MENESYIEVIVVRNGLFSLTYKKEANLDLKIGQLIEIPFQNKILPAIVVAIETKPPSNIRIKSITKEHVKLDYQISIDTIELIKKASQYYLCDIGTIAKLSISVNIFELPIKELAQEFPSSFNLAELSREQKKALKKISLNQKVSLLQGVTGSGKTEIYFHYISERLKLGEQVLIMMPEIAITSQIAARFKNVFGFEAAIWNSSITKARKRRILRGVISGNVKAMIGTRSSLFLPFKKLGAIIVDEEHDQSYKQAEGITYNARDMAVLRGVLSGAKTILASATPSIESLYNVEIGKYQLVTISSRFNDALLPRVEIIDLKKYTLKKHSWLAEPLVNEIKKRLFKKEQIAIFLNRRGYAPLLLCKSCGHRFECSYCSASFVVHKSKNCMECHHCGYAQRIADKCLECNSVDLSLAGPGIERIEEETKNLFPNSKIAVLSREQSIKANQLSEILENMEKGEIDILIGTQIITKGYHFPNLTLVCIVDADMSLFGGDYRSSEKTYQMLCQVGGRAGREKDKEGLIMIQTYNPENKVFECLVQNDSKAFIEYEIKSRKEHHLPPYSKMAAIYFTGKNENMIKKFALTLYKQAPKSGATLLGPAEALMYKIAGKYRYRILVNCERNFDLQKYLECWVRPIKVPSQITLKIDIDPYQLF